MANPSNLGLKYGIFSQGLLGNICFFFFSRVKQIQVYLAAYQDPQGRNAFWMEVFLLKPTKKHGTFGGLGMDVFLMLIRSSFGKMFLQFMFLFPEICSFGDSGVFFFFFNGCALLRMLMRF